MGAFTNRNGLEWIQITEQTWNNQIGPYIFIILVYKLVQMCVTIKLLLDEHF